MKRSLRPIVDTFIKYGLYPTLLGLTLCYLAIELNQPKTDLGKYYGYYLATLVATMVLIETLHPMQRQWRMTRATLLHRDLPYLLISAATITAANLLAGWVVLRLGVERGSAHAAMPLLPAAVLAIVIPEFFWYWVHRWSHEARGPIGHWMWRMHLPHHMPQQLYVMMHVVAHPLNTLIVRLILTLPLFLLGFSTEAVFVASVVVGTQGVLSHFNVDMRAGWLNYLIVGNELHRYHHSADIDEAKNFGNTTPLWDILFGTFVYRPGVAPRALGLANASEYPSERRILRVLGLAFRT